MFALDSEFFIILVYKLKISTCFNRSVNFREVGCLNQELHDLKEENKRLKQELEAERKLKKDCPPCYTQPDQCPKGTYCHAPCPPPSQCPAGTYCHRPCPSTPPPKSEQTSCPAGTYCHQPCPPPPPPPPPTPPVPLPTTPPTCPNGTYCLSPYAQQPRYRCPAGTSCRPQSPAFREKELFRLRELSEEAHDEAEACLRFTT